MYIYILYVYIYIYCMYIYILYVYIYIYICVTAGNEPEGKWVKEIFLIPIIQVVRVCVLRGRRRYGINCSGRGGKVLGKSSGPSIATCCDQRSHVSCCFTFPHVLFSSPFHAMAWNTNSFVSHTASVSQGHVVVDAVSILIAAKSVFQTWSFALHFSPCNQWMHSPSCWRNFSFFPLPWSQHVLHRTEESSTKSIFWGHEEPCETGHLRLLKDMPKLAELHQSNDAVTADPHGWSSVGNGGLWPSWPNLTWVDSCWFQQFQRTECIKVSHPWRRRTLTVQRRPTWIQGYQ